MGKRISPEESASFIESIVENKAIFLGEITFGEDNQVYFDPEEDIGSDISNLIIKLKELQEENDKLIGENIRLSNKK